MFAKVIPWKYACDGIISKYSGQEPPPPPPPFHIKTVSCLTPLFPAFWQNISPTQYLILNKKVSENDDDDDYKFFWNKKQGRNKGFKIWGMGKK